MTDQRVFVEDNLVNVEFTSVDDVRFNVCLDGDQLEILLYKLLTARDYLIVGRNEHRREIT